jgi:hypothetical protein
VLAILFLAGAFVVPHFAAVSTASGIIALAGWTFISGLFVDRPSIITQKKLAGKQSRLLSSEQRE